MKKAIVGNTVQFTFDGLDGVIFDADKAHDAVRAYAMMHGFMQRLGDNAAISRTQKDGTVITVTEQMRRDAVMELVNHYESGTENWNLAVSSKAPKQNAAILALSAQIGKTYAETEAAMANGNLAELMAM
jgi:hypothetical protein